MLPYPDHVLPSDKVSVFPTFQEVGYFKKYFQGGEGCAVCEILMN